MDLHLEEEEQDLPSLHDLLIATATQKHNLHADVTSTAANAYLDHLIALPLESLVQEPVLISAETSTVESELTNLCYREYPTFLSVHKCSAAVSNAFDDFQSSLDGLLDSVPSLEDECRAFSRRTVALSTVRHRSVLVQEHQEKLLDLLELPRLMETCVRNGYYHEAMELASHARDLHQRYPDTRLVTDVNVEVDGVQQLMLAQLFALLREPIKLQNSIKTIGYLRRLKLLDEPSLSLAFLSGRLLNFRNQLLQIEKDRIEPTRYVRRYIDLFRENVYEIMSQYCALFDDFDLLVSFAGQCVTDLSHLITSYIPRIANDSASMSSILIQLGYCSLSFARIGLDFSSLVPAPFVETVLSTYAAAVSNAADGLSAALTSASTSRGSPMDSMVAPGEKTLLSTPFDSSDSSFLNQLAAIPSLARYVNEHLTALNGLRLLAPTSLEPKLAEVLSASLVASTKSIHTFVVEALSSSTPFEGTSRPGHSRMPSSPRSRIIRRSTETQLPPAALAVKRRESQQFCVWLAAAWQAVAKYVSRSLEVGVYDDHDSHLSVGLKAALDDLGQWAASQGEPQGASGTLTSEQNGATGSREHNTIREAKDEDTPLHAGLVAEPLEVPATPSPPSPKATPPMARVEVEPEIHEGAESDRDQSSALNPDGPDVFGDPGLRKDKEEGERSAVEPTMHNAEDVSQQVSSPTPARDRSTSGSIGERNPNVVEAMFSAGPDLETVADADMEAALNTAAPTEPVQPTDHVPEASGLPTPGQSGEELPRELSEGVGLALEGLDAGPSTMGTVETAVEAGSSTLVQEATESIDLAVTEPRSPEIQTELPSAAAAVETDVAQGTDTAPETSTAPETDAAPETDTPPETDTALEANAARDTAPVQETQQPVETVATPDDSNVPTPDEADGAEEAEPANETASKETGEAGSASKGGQKKKKKKKKK